MISILIYWSSKKNAPGINFNFSWKLLISHRFPLDRIVQPFWHLQVKFHCCGSSFHSEQKCYTYSPSYVEVAKLLVSVLMTIGLYACLTPMLPWLNNILNSSMRNIVSFLDKHLSQSVHIYWWWYPALHASERCSLGDIIGHDWPFHHTCVISLLAENFKSNNLYGWVHYHAKISPLEDVYGDVCTWKALQNFINFISILSSINTSVENMYYTVPCMFTTVSRTFSFHNTVVLESFIDLLSLGNLHTVKWWPW